MRSPLNRLVLATMTASLVFCSLALEGSAEEKKEAVKITFDEHVAPILRANHLFRAVAVDAGKSRVVFEYAPPALQRGAWASLAGALLLAGLTAAWIRPGPARLRDRESG